MSVALTIAGSDSGGGAGIQADLKTFSALCVFGTSAITAVTVQNTQGVYGVVEIAAEMVAAQIDAVASDFEVGGVKTGMLSSAAIIEAVCDRVLHWRFPNLVVDPVMIAKGGDRLLHTDAVHTLRRELLPLATVVTPNIPEAEVLSGMAIGNDNEREEAARRIHAMGPHWVVIKGGHMPGAPIDLVWDGESFTRLSAERIESSSTHGTGCTFAAAIAAHLARDASVPDAIRDAKRFVTEAIRHAEGLGHGNGPLNHHFRWCTESADHER